MSLNNFNYSVSWSDFNQIPSRPAGQDEDAYTKARYGHNYQFERNGNAVTISGADVDITMVFSDCWAVSSQTTNELQRHEQGHYDITALGAREFYNALLRLSANSVNALQASAAQLNQRYQHKINRANARYDTQTDHSRNTQVQQTWNQRIAAEMQRTDGSIDNLP